MSQVSPPRFIEAADPALDTDSSPLKSFAKTYCCRLSYSGDSLVYEEASRSAEMRVTLAQGYLIEPGTLNTWRYTDGAQTPVTGDERLEIVRRVVHYAREVQGVLMSVRI